MADGLLQYVGSQIKMFRKIQKLTIDDLAKIINKSKSTVSKYESGEISIDIVTLYEIANALNINVTSLMDYEGNEETEKNEAEENLFWQADHLYLYHQDNKKIYCSYMQLRKDENRKKTTATLYYKVSDMDDLKSSECVYQGYMNQHDNILDFYLKNCLYGSESVLINFFVPMKKTTTLAGLMVGLQGVTLRPACVKVVLSKTQLSSEGQEKFLQLSRESLKRLKDEHMFIIDDL